LPVCVEAIAKVRNFVTGRAMLVSRPYLNFTMGFVSQRFAAAKQIVVNSESVQPKWMREVVSK